MAENNKEKNETRKQYCFVSRRFAVSLLIRVEKTSGHGIQTDPT